MLRPLSKQVDPATFISVHSCATGTKLGLCVGGRDDTATAVTRKALSCMPTPTQGHICLFMGRGRRPQALRDAPFTSGWQKDAEGVAQSDVLIHADAVLRNQEVDNVQGRVLWPPGLPARSRHISPAWTPTPPACRLMIDGDAILHHSHAITP